MVHCRSERSRSPSDGPGSCEHLRRAGAPLVPFRSIRLVLPPDHQIGTLEVRPLVEPITIAIAEPMEYGRIPEATAAGNAVRVAAVDGPDAEIYTSGQPHPADWVEQVSLQRMAGYQIALLRVFPVRYLPPSGHLLFAPQLEVRLTTESAAAYARNVRPPARLADRARERVADWVENPEALKQYAPRAVSLQGDESFDYLLVTRSNLVAAFQPLVDLKRQNGLAVKIETVESITSTQPGLDSPERIRNFIRSAYTQWGVTYVLLGGDATIVPCRYAYANMNLSEVESRIPADLYYACLDGSWNSDGDDRWGESTDGPAGGEVDLLAEVSVGRAPVDTAEEVATFVEKTLRYETLGHLQPEQVLLVAEYLKNTATGPAQGGDLFEPTLPYLTAYQQTWLDDRPFTTPQWTKPQLQTALDHSPHLALFNGHGDSETLMSPSLTPSRGIRLAEIDALTNTTPFLAYSVGCNVGQFDNDRWSPDAVGEELVKRNRHGAFAAIFNSRLGWYDPIDESKYSGEFQARFFEHLLARGQTNLGVANQFSRHDLVGQIESSGLMPYRWCYYEITLLGDPHVAWQTPTPTATPDTDGDGMHDLAEQVAGTDPADPASVLAVRVLSSAESAGQIRLEWPAAQGRSYSILRALVPDGPFELLAGNLPATPPLNSYPVTTDSGRWFYRIEVQISP